MFWLWFSLSLFVYHLILSTFSLLGIFFHNIWSIIKTHSCFAGLCFINMLPFCYINKTAGRMGNECVLSVCHFETGHWWFLFTQVCIISVRPLNHTGIGIFTVNLEPKHLYLPLNINIIFLSSGELLIGFIQTEILKISFISEIEGI